MPWGVAAAAVVTAGSIYSADTQASAQQNAANTQAQAAAQQQQNLLAAGQSASQQFTPYANYGTTALGSLTANNNYFNHQFSNADLNANLNPNYAFQLQQGETSAAQQANATGGLVSGNAQQALNTFGQNYAQTAYTNAFNQYQDQRGNISAIDIANANLGLSGATGSANAQLGTATNIANLGIGSANAQAASQIAQGNVYGNAINTATGAGYSALSGMNGSLFGSTNNGGSYNDFGAGAGQSGNSGFTVSPNAPSGTSFQLA